MPPLTSAEKDQLAQHLSYAARVGGYFLLGMGSIVAGISVLLVYRITQNTITSGEEALSGLIVFCLAFVIPGLWLTRRQQTIREQLNGELRLGTAEIIATTEPSESGWHIQLRLLTPDGEEKESNITAYAQPPWSVGEQIDLIFLDNDTHFFPQQLNFNAQMGEIPTIATKNRRRRIGTVLFIIFGCLILLGLAIGIITSATG